MNEKFLVTSSARCRVSIPLQTQKDFLESRKVGRVWSSAGKGLALRVLEVDEGANAFPSRPL